MEAYTNIHLFRVIGEYFWEMCIRDSMKVELSGSYSGWQPNVDSPILHAMTLSYKQQFGMPVPAGPTAKVKS